MKFTSALASAAVLAISAEAKLGYKTDYAQKVVAETKEHLERIHGRGLTGLFDEHGTLQGHHFKKGYKSSVMQGAQIKIPGVDKVLDVDSFVTNFLGFVSGLTFTGVQSDGNALTNCFYSGYTLVKNADDIIYIF